MKHPVRILAVVLLCLLLVSGGSFGAWARPTVSANSQGSTADTTTDGSVLPFPPVPSASASEPMYPTC